MPLPIIDFEPFLSGAEADKQNVAQAIHKALREAGAFYLTHHGISEACLAACFAEAEWFFAQPLTEKEKIHIDKSPHHRGWYGLGGENLDPQNARFGDIKEGIKLGNELPPTHPFVQKKLPLHGENQWPERARFKTAMQNGFAAFSQLGTELMQAIAISLNLPQNYFAPFLRTPMTTLSPLFYPPLKQHYAQNKQNNIPDIMSAHSHSDFGCLSMLAQSRVAGLQILTMQNEWLAVPPRPDSLVVNIGDMLALWTGGYYRATPHRVLNVGDENRLSLVFFFDPQYDTPLTNLLNHNETKESETKKNEIKENEIKEKENEIKEKEKAAPPTALDYLLQKINESFTKR